VVATTLLVSGAVLDGTDGHNSGIYIIVYIIIVNLWLMVISKRALDANTISF